MVWLEITPTSCLMICLSTCTKTFIHTHTLTLHHSFNFDIKEHKLKCAYRSTSLTYSDKYLEFGGKYLEIKIFNKHDTKRPTTTAIIERTCMPWYKQQLKWLKLKKKNKWNV